MKCRLCLGTKKLLDVFDTRLTKSGESLRRNIHLCTGIEIKSSEPLSTMVCQICLDEVVLMVRFRYNALNNDRELKAVAKMEYKMPTPYPEIIEEQSKRIEEKSKILITIGETPTIELNSSECDSDFHKSLEVDSADN